MGRFNSSVTRVVPVFDRLFADRSGVAWLGGLLDAGSRTLELRRTNGPPRLVEGHRRTWGDDELALPAPRSLLEHLIRNITAQQVARSRDTGIAREKRAALAQKDAATIAEALQLLDSGAATKQWYVLEGPSKPDATLEMLDAVLVVEGKRTEHSCTSATTWMGVRSQLLRHMDAAMDHFPGKRVLGLLLVEGCGGSEATGPSPHWINECSAQYAPAMLSASLPHRSTTERTRLAEGILGVATWQAICAQNGFPWPPVPDQEFGRQAKRA